MPASTPELASAFGVSGASAVALVLVAPLVLSTVLEPVLLLAADRARERRGYVRAGLLALALGLIGVVLAPSAWVAAVVLALYVPLWSVSLGVAQGALVDAAPEQVERTMTRWTLAASLGDLAAPALLALALLLGGDWRYAFGAIVALALFPALAMPRLPRPARAPATGVAGDDEDEERPRWAVLREALGRRRLLAWELGVWLCGLLDEIFVAFAALHLDAYLGAGAAGRALVLGVFLACNSIALVVIERLLLRMDGRTLLAWLAGAGMVALAAWIAAPSLAWSVVLAGLLGFTVAGQYPLAKAQAYRAAPGRPGTVNALAAMLGPLDLVAPLVLAFVADRAGVTVALLVLGIQPLGLFVLAVLVPPVPSAGSS